MSKVLVTGGAGFIGSNLVEALVDGGHDVTVLDDFSMGRKENLASVSGKVRVFKGDIRDANLVGKLTKGVDFVFNQAAASSSPMFKERPQECMDININGFINVLRASKENGVRRVIYASTSSIYANNTPPLKEDMKVVPPNLYSVTKLANEQTAAIFNRDSEIETVGLRYMSVYGPHEEAKSQFANLASQFLWALKKGEQPVIYGDGRQTRDFTYVKDVVKANVLAMTTKKKMNAEVLNVGSGKATDLNKLVSMICMLLGKKIKPTYVRIPEFFRKNYIATQLADLAKIEKVLGYKPQYNLERGIAELLDETS